MERYACSAVTCQAERMQDKHLLKHNASHSDTPETLPWWSCHLDHKSVLDMLLPSTLPSYSACVMEFMDPQNQV